MVPGLVVSVKSCGRCDHSLNCTAYHISPIHLWAIGTSSCNLIKILTMSFAYGPPAFPISNFQNVVWHYRNGDDDVDGRLGVLNKAMSNLCDPGITV